MHLALSREIAVQDAQAIMTLRNAQAYAEGRADQFEQDYTAAGVEEYADWREASNTLKAFLPETREQWIACTRAANRLADLVCLMYHPRDEKARKTWPTATWAEIIASELGIEVPDTTGGN